MTIIAIIPGTGNMGFGFSRLYAKAGHTVLLVSRESEKAKEAAARIIAEFPNAVVKAGRKDEVPLNEVRNGRIIGRS